MSSARNKRKTAAAAETESRIHTPLTLDDRDAFDLLRHRIAWQATLVQRIITTWDSEDDEIDDADRPILESGLLELCRSIVDATDEMRELCNVAEKRRARRSSSSAAGDDAPGEGGA